VSDPDPAPVPPAAARLFSPPFVALLIMQTAFGFASSVFLLLPKVLASALGASAAQIGAVTAMYGLASLAAVPFLGPQMDRRGTRAPIVMGNALLLASALGFATVTSIGPLAAVLRGMQGLAWTMLFNAGMTLTTTLAPPGRLAQAIGVYGSANLVMNAVAPAVAEPLIDVLGHRRVFLIAAAVAALGLLLSARLIEPRHEPPHRPLPGVPALLRRRRLRALAAQVLISGIALNVAFTLYQPFALALGLRNVRGFFIGYTAGALVVRLGAGALVDRLGHRRATVGSLVIYSLVVAGMSLLGPGRLVPLGVVFGIAHGTFLPAVMALAVAGVELPMRGRILALMNGGLAAGAAFVPVVGAIADRVGYPIVFTATGLLTLAAVAITPGDP
jgi:MFS family permease